MPPRVLTTLAVLALVLAAVVAGADADPGHQPYIMGEVSSRVRGKNAAYVNVRWDFKCLEDTLGESTFSWTLKQIRLQPKPKQTRTIATGRSKRGIVRLLLRPGKYDLIADPFSCRTDRGLGSTTPEPGFPFIVPDFCAWSVLELRGRPQLRRGGVRRALEAGHVVRPGNVVRTPRRSWVQLASNGEDSALRVGPRTRVAVDARHCGRTGGWRFSLAAGSVRAELSEGAERGRRYEIRSPNATARARRGVWTVETRTRGGAPWTRIVVRAGAVTVRGGAGRPMSVRAGRETIVAGSKAPARPRRAR